MAETHESRDVERTTLAFEEFRAQIGSPRRPPEQLIKNDGEVQQMSAQDGLEQLVDGPVGLDGSIPTGLPRPIEQGELQQRDLWAVRDKDVVYAKEQCNFGKGLQTGVIKHTNLTGGGSAYAGGELLWLQDVLVVNGRSGRYHPKSADEMASVARAFARSGYQVWSMGYDTEADFPYPFVGVLPQCVA